MKAAVPKQLLFEKFHLQYFKYHYKETLIKAALLFIKSHFVERDSEIEVE